MPTKLIPLALISALFASLALAEGPTAMKIDFSVPGQAADWRPVNDGVMGGRSSGSAVLTEDHLTFKGVINTNGGGFASLRAPVTKGELISATALKLRVKSDGRAYRLLLQTDARYWGARVSFQAPIPETPTGAWAEVEIPMTGWTSSVRGRAVTADFDASKTRTIGIILADGRDGPFELSIAFIEAIGTAP